ncbi:hypothetical protein Ddye_026808 [Dipteronia dyeriana]|uniref:DUF4283 domain-containing protein n=1 Tax=Dipteronia dyeriana TaxID=168575 RepID=A0AAD9TND5_9ROSI|nr:hypothetical protein Ddye_026808 [Dipteronia dyeriana]
MFFNRVAFWVQIHNVPLFCMTKEIGVFLAKMVGEFREIDIGPPSECVGKYITIWVVINVDEPLRRILKVDVFGDGTESTMLLRYEKLPKHCFRYGRLRHVVKDCPKDVEGDGPEDFNLLFGPWLKDASPDKKNFQNGGSRNENSKPMEASRMRNQEGPDLQLTRNIKAGNLKVKMAVEAKQTETSVVESDKSVHVVNEKESLEGLKFTSITSSGANSGNIFEVDKKRGKEQLLDGGVKKNVGRGEVVNEMDIDCGLGKEVHSGSIVCDAN